MRCDSHAHIVGPPRRFPQVPERRYLAGIAALDTLRRLGAGQGVSRFVIVQPSFYGTDNSATPEAVDALGVDGRGVAVIDPSKAEDAPLADFARRGIRGLRINLYSRLQGRGPGSVVAMFGPQAKVAQAMGWHVQVIAPAAMLVDGAEVLAGSPVPVVIDHYGLHGRVRPDSGEGRRLLELLRLPHVWTKLSAPYRVSDNPREIRPSREWLGAILEAAADRCVWGSDWPFTPPNEEQKGPDVPADYRAVSYAALVGAFLAALPTPELADRIMVGNPARLYGF